MRLLLVAWQAHGLRQWAQAEVPIVRHLSAYAKQIAADGARRHHFNIAMAYEFDYQDREETNTSLRATAQLAGVR